jgi:hypothetical protein
MDVIRIEPRPVEAAQAERLCRHLERGDILLLERAPFLPSAEDAAFLREQRQSGSAVHKNIAYKPHLKRTTGLDARAPEEAERLHRIMSGYSEGAIRFMTDLVPPYSRHWRVDYASFRPEEEKGRSLPLKHRNDLMHVDAFPTRPTHGGRILRVFTNLNPARDRVWGVAEDFDSLAERFAMEAGLGRVTSPLASARRGLRKAARGIGVRLPDRSPYDEFMLGFHHFLKGHSQFQETGQRHTVAFPPGATWISFTDQVAHKVTSGQFAVEQTFIVPVHAMLLPDCAPVTILERLAGRKLVSQA